MRWVHEAQDFYTLSQSWTSFPNVQNESRAPITIIPDESVKRSQQLTASFELNTTLLIEPDSQRRMQSLQVRRWEGGESWVRVKRWLHWQLGEVGEDVSEEVGEGEK